MVVKRVHFFLQLLLAVFLGYLLLTRLFISWVQFAPEQFIKSVEWVSQSEVSFDKIALQQNWLGFQFQLQNFVMHHDSFDLTIQSLDMDVNLFSALIPALKYGDFLTIKQATYVHKAPQTTLLSAEEMPSMASLDSFTDFNVDVSQLWKQLNLSEIVLKSVYSPELSVQIYRYQSFKGRQLHVVSEFGIGYKEGLNFERFGLKARLDTNLLGRVEQGEINVFSLHPLRVKALANLWPLAWHDKIPRGELLLDLYAKVDNSSLSKIILNLNTQSLKWPEAHSTLPKHLGVELLWESHLNVSSIPGWQFKLSKIQLDNQYIQNVSEIELRFEDSQFLTLKADYFDIDSFKAMVQSLASSSTISALFDKTSELEIKNVHAQFDWKAFKLPKLDMTVKQLVLPVTDYPGLAIHDLTILKKQDQLVLEPSGSVTLSGLNLPKGGGNIYLPKQIQLSYSVLEKGWVLPPLDFQIDQMPITFSAWANTQGDVDAQLMVQVGTMQTLKQYLPYSLLSERLHVWLDQALVSGENIQANVRLKGALNDFPFQDGSGIFSIQATVDKAAIQFDPDWPMLENITGQLEFTPYRLTITSPQVQVDNNLYAQDVEVVIDSLDQKDIALVFQGRVHSYLKQGVQYLSRTPLAQWLNLEAFINGTKFDGAIDVVLNRVWIPVAGYLDREEKVSGHVQFLQASMAMFDTVELDNIQGRLKFNEKGVSANRLSAHMFSHKALFSVETFSNPELIKIKGEGKFLPESNALFDSALPWQAHLDIPLYTSEHGVNIEVKVPFNQANSLLPAPLDTATLQDKSLSVRINLDTKNNAVLVHSVLPEIFAMKGRWQSVKSGYQVSQLEWLLGREIETGFVKNKQKNSYVRGYLTEVDVDDWGRYLPKLALDKFWQQGRSDLNWEPSWIVVDALTFREHLYPNVRLEWLARNVKTVLQIKSSDVLANIVIKAHEPVELNVERLRLHTLDSSKEEVPSTQSSCQSGEPSSVVWPEILFNGQRIEISGYLVDSLQFHLMDSASHLTISDLNGAFGKGAGTLTGQYFFDKTSSKSHLSLLLRSKKVTELLRFMQLKQGFTGKKAKVETTLFWPGALECFSSKSVTGQLNFELEEGTIEDIEPGFARLIGLLSVESLARRLKLDLKDVTNKGMVYDQIKGQAQLESGALHLDSFGLKAPSASVALFGKVDLLKETFNLKAYVTPTIGAAIPTIAALAGYANPLAALAVYSVMKVLPGVNENLVTFRYDVTGPWEAPKVVERKARSEEVSQPLFEPEDSILDTQRK